MDGALDTIFYLLERERFDLPGSHIAFWGARYHRGLDALDSSGLMLQQFFKPFTDELQARGYNAAPVPPGEKVDAALALLPKNAVESRHMIASTIKMLRPDGVVVAAADNRAGGGRLRKMLEDFGLEVQQEISKNKARAVLAVCRNPDRERIETHFAAGERQHILNGKWLSQPGIFGWDKIDKGSELLASCLPESLSGSGADFGCGYGFLARTILERGPGVSALSCLDADWRAVEACRRNLVQHSAAKSFLWADLTRQPGGLAPLDFIVMNPPFHEGKNTDISIGKAFIETAAQSLKKGGALWMVANAHLPYEGILKDRFAAVSKLCEERGFKAFHAVL